MLDHFEQIKAELTPAELIGWLKGHLVFLRVELAHEQSINAAIKAADEARYIGFGEVVPNPVCDFRARGVM